MCPLKLGISSALGCRSLLLDQLQGLWVNYLLWKEELLWREWRDILVYE